MMVFAEGDPDFLTEGESKMMPHLVAWLRRVRWVRNDSVVVREFPINGRRADLITMTRSGVISAYELKLGGFGRALEQAVYNSYSVDRSWMVVGSEPRADNLREATKFGIGVIVIRDCIPRIVVRPSCSGVDEGAKTRVGGKLAKVEVSCV